MQTLKTSISMIAIIVLTVIATECLLRILFIIRDAGSDPVTTSTVDSRALLPAYQGAEYDPAALWREIWAGTNIWLNYEPYTVWSRKPISGEYVNVDDSGRRVTTDNSTAADAFVIWSFGGSTTWGMAVPDAETLPSQLSRRFNAAGVPTRVRNFGETGFVATQDLLALVRALQNRPAPDLVVFYEGANEPLGLTDRPDLVNPHYLMDRIQGLFEQTIETEHPAVVLLKQTAFYRLADALGNRIATVVPVSRESTYPTPLEDIPDVARTSAQAYRTNLEIITSLAGEYGFTPYFFFQPRLGVGAKTLDESERQLLDDLREDRQEDWMIRFTIELRKQTVEAIGSDAAAWRFHDIADVFADTPAPVYVDWVHVSHTGNARIADEIFRIIRADTCGPAGQPRAKALQALCNAGGS